MILIIVLFFLFWDVFFHDTVIFLLQVVSILLTIGKPTHSKATLPNYKASHWRKKSRLWVDYSWDLQNQCLNCSELNCRLQFYGKWVGDFYFLRTVSNSSLGAYGKMCWKDPWFCNTTIIFVQNYEKVEDAIKIEYRLLGQILKW